MVSVDKIAVVEELKPNHEETDTRMLVHTLYEPLYEKTVFFFAYAKTKTQISFAVTAKLISAFVSATWIVQSL